MSDILQVRVSRGYLAKLCNGPISRREEMSESGFYRSMTIQRDRFMEIVRKPPDSRAASCDFAPTGPKHDSLGQVSAPAGTPP